jgi:hypothetical protein
MSHSAYPLAADLTAFLTEAGLTTTGIDVTNGIAAGIAAFERACGRRFLSTVDAARTFDPPIGGKGILDLRADLASITSVVAASVTQVAGTDYRALPQDAASEGKPYNRLEFAGRWYAPLSFGSYGSVVITGKWAYSATAIPDDAWTAMLAAGAIERLPQITTYLTGGLIEWTEEAHERYGEKPLAFLREGWQAQVDAAVARYRRVTVGF